MTTCNRPRPQSDFLTANALQLVILRIARAMVKGFQDSGIFYFGKGMWIFLLYRVLRNSSRNLLRVIFTHGNFFDYFVAHRFAGCRPVSA